MSDDRGRIYSGWEHIFGGIESQKLIYSLAVKRLYEAAI